MRPTTQTQLIRANLALAGACFLPAVVIDLGAGLETMPANWLISVCLYTGALLLAAAALHWRREDVRLTAVGAIGVGITWTWWHLVPVVDQHGYVSAWAVGFLPFVVAAGNLLELSHWRPSGPS